MNQIFAPSLLLCLILTSCATIFNSKTVKLHLFTDIDSAQFIVNHADTLCCSTTQIEVPRSRNDISIGIVEPQNINEIQIKSELDPLFVVGNLYPFYGLGWIIDLTNQKRFMYDKFNYVYLDNNTLTLSQPSLPINLFIGINGVNLNKLNYQYHNTSAISYGGINTGAELYIKPQTYLSSTLHINFPGSQGKYSDQFEFNSVILNLLLNRTFHRFQAGMGLNFFYIKQNNYTYNNFQAYGPGVATELQYRFYDNFYISANYNSLIYNINNNKLSNTGVFSFGVKYKIEMGNLDDKNYMKMIKK